MTRGIHKQLLTSSSASCDDQVGLKRGRGDQESAEHERNEEEEAPGSRVLYPSVILKGVELARGVPHQYGGAGCSAHLGAQGEAAVQSRGQLGTAERELQEL